jgi:clan AA aspartic protease
MQIYLQPEGVDKIYNMVHISTGIRQGVRDMGKVKVNVKLANFVDMKNAEIGLIPKEKLKTIDIEMLVDTGATMLSIGEDLAEQLGIKKEKEIFVALADGSIQRHFKGLGVLVEIGDRNCVTDCIILERGVEPLLGQIPLEEMDLVVDCKNKQLIPNPESFEGKVVLRLK